MNKIYFVRHQAHGVVHDFPFLQHPTQEQVAAVSKYCFNLHGFGHPKTPKEPFWTRVVEFDVLGPSDIPKVPERELSVVGEPGAAKTRTGEIVTSGTGVVTKGSP